MNFGKVIGLSLLCVCVIAGNAWANPKSATANLAVTDSGQVTLRADLDKKVTSSSCLVEFRGRLREGLNPLGSAKVVGTKKVAKGKRIAKIVVKGMPGFVHEDGQETILDLQAKVTCPKKGGGTTTLLSDADADYILCGKGTKALASGNAWLKRLKKFADAATD